MKEQLEKIEALAKQELESCTQIKELDDLRVKYLGKKGELTAILKQMGKLSPEERPVMGQLANEVRSEIETLITESADKIKKIEMEKALEKISDVMNEGGVIICEAPYGDEMPENAGTFTLIKKYRYGKTGLFLYRFAGND